MTVMQSRVRRRRRSPQLPSPADSKLNSATSALTPTLRAVSLTDSDWSPADHLGPVALSEANAWKRALDLCASRVHDGGQDQQTDARMFLLALRQFLKAAQLAADAVAGTPEAHALQEAKEQFDLAVPNAKAACDVIEHFREYATGTGDLQSQIQPRRNRPVDREAAARDWPLSYDPRTDFIQLGQFAIGVNTAQEQAKLLHLAIWIAVRHL